LHVWDNWEIRSSEHGFMQGRSYLTNLISFEGKVSRLVDEGLAVNVFYLDFSKPLTPFPTGFSRRH